MFDLRSQWRFFLILSFTVRLTVKAKQGKCLPIYRSSIGLQFCEYSIKFTKIYEAVDLLYASLSYIYIAITPFVFDSFTDKLYLKGITLI
jgi:hypothetical protein